MVLVDQKRLFLYNTKMNNIFAKTQSVEFVSSHINLRNWRFMGMEMEALGARLDAARAALSQAKSAWGRWYWTETLDRLMLQWQAMPILHDGDVTMTEMPRWTIDYEWWDGAKELGGFGVSDKLFEKVFRDIDLNDSWDRIRNERLMQCRYK
jgi:hypothetical protein